MATDAELISDEFADTACRLLKEYSAEIEKLRIDSIDVLDAYYKSSGASDKEKWYFRRFEDNYALFRSFVPTYEKLIRRTSQWIEHAKEARPGKQLELEMRLEELQHRLNAVDRFFDLNEI